MDRHRGHRFNFAQDDVLDPAAGECSLSTLGRMATAGLAAKDVTCRLNGIGSTQTCDALSPAADRGSPATACPFVSSSTMPSQTNSGRLRARVNPYMDVCRSRFAEGLGDVWPTAASASTALSLENFAFVKLAVIDNLVIPSRRSFRPHARFRSRSEF